MAAKEILLLGNPVLRQKCSAVKDVRSADIRLLTEDLRDTLQDFRQRKGFGRGIAAPQIGSTRRVIYIDFEYAGALINPKIVQRSSNKFSLWDDCFSFPDILVHVTRNYRITVSFLDESGKAQKLKAEGALSELLQHEIDHVNGILAIDRAVDSKHIILRSEFEKLSHNSPLML
ncbi:MAG: peptide deformylase [Ignavibacteriales bacterium]|nr:peptide deformylase [Ignavibacteriales bacterium]